MPPLRSFQRKCLSLAVAQALLIPATTQAVVSVPNGARITVNTISDAADPAGCSLREALDISNTGALINNGCAVTAINVPGHDIDFDLPAASVITLNQGQLEIMQTARINGPGAEQLTIEAGGSSRIFYIGGVGDDASTSVIDGLTLNGGSVSGNGGAVYINATESVTISNSTLTNNTASFDGGGVLVDDSLSVELVGLTVLNNSAGGYGGGIYIDGSDSATISNSTISNNTANGNGGGIYIDGSDSATISNSTISNNTANGNGGGIYFDQLNNSTISGVTVTNNTADGGRGGGIYMFGGDLRLESSTISANTADEGGGLSIVETGGTTLLANLRLVNNVATGRGGGIYMYADDTDELIQLSSSTISGNSADTEGGGIFAYEATGFSITGSTIANNSAINGGGITFFDGSDGVVSNSTISGNVASGDVENIAGGLGGGLRSLSSGGAQVNLLANTIFGNSAMTMGGNNGQGGGIFAEAGSDIVLGLNNVVAGSIGGDCNVMLSNAVFNWTEDGSCLPSDLLIGDPQLGPLRDNGGPTLTHAPLDGSGLINASMVCASNSNIDEFDQRGEARGADICFIGSVEGIQEPEDEGSFFVIPLPGGGTVVVPL